METSGEIRKRGEREFGAWDTIGDVGCESPRGETAISDQIPNDTGM